MGLLGIQLNKPTLANPGHTKSQILNIRWLWTMEWTLCVCVLPSYTGHGVWWHLYKPHADLHGLMYCTFRFARGPSRPSLSQCVPAHFGWNCWTRFSTTVGFCSRDSLSSSHRFDRTKLEPVSIFKTNPMSLCRPGLYSPPALHVSVLARK